MFGGVSSARAPFWRFRRWVLAQATVPTRAPMPAVIAIAMAPQATTRTVARPRGAPPRRAPRSPSNASATSVTATVTATRVGAGVSATASSGSAAPAENETADAHAACSGRAAAARRAELVAQMRLQRAPARQGHSKHQPKPKNRASRIAVARRAGARCRRICATSSGSTSRRLARPLQAAWASAVSFSAGAALPLLAVALTPAPTRVAVTVAVTLVALALLGDLGARLGGAPRGRATVRVVAWAPLRWRSPRASAPSSAPSPERAPTAGSARKALGPTTWPNVGPTPS